jgi:hypothetical protein
LTSDEHERESATSRAEARALRFDLGEGLCEAGLGPFLTAAAVGAVLAVVGHARRTRLVGSHEAWAFVI